MECSQSKWPGGVEPERSEQVSAADPRPVEHVPYPERAGVDNHCRVFAELDNTVAVRLG